MVLRLGRCGEVGRPNPGGDEEGEDDAEEEEVAEGKFWKPGGAERSWAAFICVASDGC